METVLIDGIHYDRHAIEKDCWHRMLNGALQNKNAFHNAVVANVNEYGVNMRTVVLRKAWPTGKQLVFYTDTRSGKWLQLQQQHNISWLFYDDKVRIQIRASGVATLHHKDELADKGWGENHIMNRKNYLSLMGPSAKTTHPTSGLPSELENEDITIEQSEAGRKNFGVVITHIKWMEWLCLGSKGHRRAGFTYKDDGSFTASWLVP